MKKSTILKTGILLVIVGLLLIHFYAPRFIIEIKNPVLNIVRSTYTPEVNFKDESTLRSKPISFRTHDKLMLFAQVCYADADTAKGTIILLHGIRAGKEHYIPICTKLAKNGYNAVALDQRAHGESEGKFCTFGVKEKQDVVTLIDHLQNEEGIDTPIGIWGQSLGGAVALQSMAIDDRIEFGIIESTFADLRSTSHDYFQFHLGFNTPFFTNYLVSRAGELGDFDPDHARPVDFCRQIKQPILMVHGEKDQRISIRYGKQNFENIASERKQFIEMKNASHLDVWKKGGDVYFARVFEFLDRQ